MNIIQMVLIFIEGILTFVSPCILPLIPIYVVYLAGVSDYTEIQDNQKGTLLINSIGFVVGFTIVFVTLGMTATALGSFLGEHIDIFRRISGLIMVLLGLNFAGILNIKFLNTEKRFEYNFKQLKFVNSIIFGLVFSIGWTPCVGTFLSSALLMASNSSTIYLGGFMLFVFSMGLGIPFIVTAVIFDKIKSTIKLLQRNLKIINIISGIILVLAGILIFFDRFKYLNII